MTRYRFALFALVTVAALLGPVAPAGATNPAPAWRIEALTNTTAAPGASMQYLLQVSNVGDADSTAPADPTCDPNNGPLDPDCLVIQAEIPAGITATTIEGGEFESSRCTGLGDPGPATVLCASPRALSIPLHSAGSFVFPTLNAQVDADSGTLTAHFQVSGGGAPEAATTVDPVTVTATPPPFGLAAFDTQVAGNAAGAPATEAAGHPYSITTSFEFDTVQNPDPLIGPLWPVAPVRDVVAELPPGFLGNPTAAPQCTIADLAHSSGVEPRSLCKPSAQVGTTLVHLKNVAFLGGRHVRGPIPVFNLVPPAGVPARFGFNSDGIIVTFDAGLRSDGDYGLTVDSRNVPEIAIAGSSVTFWGSPADPVHTPERSCPAVAQSWKEGGPTCPSELEGQDPAFLRDPTACTAPGHGLPFAAHVDSWPEPGLQGEGGAPDLTDPAWRSAAIETHGQPGYPSPPAEWGAPSGIEGCAGVPFTPEIEAQPTTDKADSPSGLGFDLRVPQTCWEAGEAASTCQSDLRRAEVTLPAGMTVNPASASGLGSCSATQIGLKTAEGATPIHFDQAPPSCPGSSELGRVRIETPLLEEDLEGPVYLAAQGDNPFRSLLALYIVASDPARGVTIKLPAHVEADPATGQLRTVVDELPQLPFSHMHLELFPGQRASLRTPPACGEYATEAALTPWSHQGAAGEEGTPIAAVHSSFKIEEGPGGGACPAKPAAFAPKLSAGTRNPLAGVFSPFDLRLTRDDGTQNLAGLDVTLPPGLIGKLAGVPYCSDAALGGISGNEGTAAAQLAGPSCPAASQVGTVTAGAGAGADPFYLSTGKAYLAGPYKGAPLSLAVVTPALAGPFDLGNVVVRAALRIDPETVQIEAVSDPLPTSLFGIPLDLRDLRVDIDRPGFTLNPTSCDPMAVNGTVRGTEGGSANLSNRFQVGGCDKLGFKPKLSFRLKGKTRRGGNPQFSATLTMPPGGANIARAQVSLPHSEFLDQAHIKTICTRVQFAANQCPAKSVYGHARAITPLLDKPLEGPVYLRSSSHNLPDLVADLNGQIHVVLDGRIDSHNKGIRNTFELVPDAPVSKFTLTMQGGAKGLLQNSRNLCKSPSKVSVEFDAQNGKIADSTPPLVAAGSAGKSHKHKPRHR